MKAMILKEICDVKVPGRPPSGNMISKETPLELVDLPVPVPGPGEVLIKVLACGVCRTELDQIEGRIQPPVLPIIPGHQPVGVVAGTGRGAKKFKAGERVGTAWIFHACGRCKFCRSGRENLCDSFQGTGCHANGGYAEYMVISQDFAYKIPAGLADAVRIAPLMCSGIVGYRSLKLTGMEDGKTLGLYGFGSAHHLVIQMAGYLSPRSRKLAMSLGADWSGDIGDSTPEKLDCAIDTTPAWKPVVSALENLEKGGRLVINAIRKEEGDKDFLLKLDYARHLWLEKEIKTVANVTRADADEFLDLAARMKIRPEVQEYKLGEANKALVELKSGKIRGSKVLVMPD
jgi:propanol-preferring alcohol dehydrogenase